MTLTWSWRTWDLVNMGFYCSLPPWPCDPKLPCPDCPPILQPLTLILRFAEKCQDFILASELEELPSQSFHPLAIKNVCITFNPSNGSEDISLKNQKPACGSKGKNQEIISHPLRSTNVFTNFRGNPSDRCWYVSVRTRVLDRLPDTEKMLLARLKTRARPRVPPERPCNCQSRYGSSDGLPAISKTFTQQLLQLNGNRSFIPKHKANGE